ncbi:hypothetical protein ACFOWX_11720 [Sphingorhabdus arenilitoris]|uniref:Type III secretion protein HrpB2 n=1 Tax=Sphingorhabdus arenilitoris TaxID=1490041 RepID=A0ABV8RI40_9SPHN
MAAESMVVSAVGNGSTSGAMRTHNLDEMFGAKTGSPEMNARFTQSMQRAEASAPVGGSEMPAPVKTMFSALDNVNVQAKAVSDYAATAEASGGQLTPGEIVQLTMKCQEFMFQCQLTSNIANRSSDGVQQLFRQQ